MSKKSLWVMVAVLFIFSLNAGCPPESDDDDDKEEKPVIKYKRAVINVKDYCADATGGTIFVYDFTDNNTVIYTGQFENYTLESHEFYVQDGHQFCWGAIHGPDGWRTAGCGDTGCEELETCSMPGYAIYCQRFVDAKDFEFDWFFDCSDSRCPFEEW